MELVIGRLPEMFDKDAAAAVKKLKARGDSAWRKADNDIATISLFNLASVCLFTDHVAKLEGIKEKGRVYELTRFKNLPWWMFNIWLPVDFHPPTEPALKDGSWPVLLGSCSGLLADLAEVQKLSKLKLGVAPKGYDRMRENYRAFFRSNFELSDKNTVIQWVWLGLHDAAQLGLDRSAPVFGAE